MASIKDNKDVLGRQPGDIAQPGIELHPSAGAISLAVHRHEVPGLHPRIVVEYPCRAASMASKEQDKTVICVEAGEIIVNQRLQRVCRGCLIEQWRYRLLEPEALKHVAGH